jgi:hypothetical protein
VSQHRRPLIQPTSPNHELCHYIDDVTTLKATDILEHTVPALSGKVYHIADDAPIRFENHSDTPNVTGMHYNWLDEAEPGAVLTKVALRDIAVGEEICVDYNGCSGMMRVFRQTFSLEDAIGSHACSLEACMRVANGIPLGRQLLLLLPPNFSKY